MTTLFKGNTVYTIFLERTGQTSIIYHFIANTKSAMGCRNIAVYERTDIHSDHEIINTKGRWVTRYETDSKKTRLRILKAYLIQENSVRDIYQRRIIIHIKQI